MAKIRALSTINPVSTVVLEQFEQHAPVFNDIEAYLVGGNADSIKKAREGTSQTIFRTLNNKTNRSGPTPDYETITKKIVYGDARVDKVLEDRNIDLDTELAYQTRIEAMEDAKVFQEKVFSGDSGSSAAEFDGIFAKLPAARDEDLSEALVLPLGGDAKKEAQQKFFETFINSQVNMPYSEFFAYFPETMRLRMLTAAKNLGYYTSIDTPDGKIEKIEKAIIKGYGYDSNGNEIMPFDDTLGGHTKTSSITYVKWGEKVDFTFATSAGFMADYLGIVDTIYESNAWNLDGAFGLQNAKALYRINGIALEEGV